MTSATVIRRKTDAQVRQRNCIRPTARASGISARVFPLLLYAEIGMIALEMPNETGHSETAVTAASLESKLNHHRQKTCQ